MIVKKLMAPLKTDLAGAFLWYREQSASHNIDDTLFHGTLAACLAFLPVWVSFINPQFMHVPLVLASFLIAVRLMLRPECRRRFTRTLVQFKFTYGALLLIYIALHALNYRFEFGTWTDIHFLRKLIILSIVFFLFVYLWSSPSEPYRYVLNGFFRIGVFFSLSVFVGLLAYNHILFLIEVKSLFPFAKEALNINRSLEVLSICVLLLLVTARGHERTAFLVLIVLVWCLSFFVVGLNTNKSSMSYVSSETVQFGLPVSLAVFFLASIWPQFISRVVFFVLTSVLVFAPWIYQIWYDIAPGIVKARTHIILDRAAIWDACAKKSLEHPWFGRGIESLRTYQDIEFRDAYVYGMPMHAHNAVLQLWMDLGLLGVVFALTLVFAAWKFSQRLNSDSLAPTLATITMVFLALIVTHSMWHTWWISTIVFMFFLMVFLNLQLDKISECQFGFSSENNAA